jgi:3',5'-cyclic AMP phosphodiesterase CpdA
MKKILHLSDLHVGYKDCGDHLKNVVNAIVAQYRPASDYVVVITGDTVDDANQDGAYDKTLAILDPLVKAKYRVLVVPGNHDYGTGGLGDRKFVRLFKLAYFGDDSISYPKVDIVDNVAFIGLDSMAATFDWLDVIGADGELGKKQLSALEKLLTGEELAGRMKVVYLHHHPFDGKGKMHMLKDYKKFKEVVENRIDCLLFGHNHDGNQYPDVWGIPHCYDASSSTGKSAPKKPATKVRVIEL